MNIGIAFVMVLYGILGGLSTAFLFVGMPGVFLWKCYRKAKYNISLMD